MPQDPIFCLDLKGYALARLGRDDEAHKILDQLQVVLQQGKPVEGAIGVVYLGLSDYDKAIDQFEVAVGRDGLPEDFYSDPFMAQIRDLPRVQALVKKAEAQRGVF
jgi:tetratricopeptide (TPR) repeat protein